MFLGFFLRDLRSNSALPHICSGHFSYEIKTKLWPYSYIQTSKIGQSKIYQDIILLFISILFFCEYFNKNNLRIYFYNVTNDKNIRKNI